MATVNIGIKVSRTITATTTVAAGAYVIADYVLTSAMSASSSTGEHILTPGVITRHFGPGATVPATFTTPMLGVTVSGNPMTTYDATYTLSSGVELINTL
jgi:hypothetical protein